MTISLAFACEQRLKPSGHYDRFLQDVDPMFAKVNTGNCSWEVYHNSKNLSCDYRHNRDIHLYAFDKISVALFTKGFQYDLSGCPTLGTEV
jgi:hypothetical protein